MGVLASLEVSSGICFLSVTRLQDRDMAFAVRLINGYLAILNLDFYFTISCFNFQGNPAIIPPAPSAGMKSQTCCLASQSLFALPESKWLCYLY